MPFYVRKSLNFGGIRLNISKNGIGTSVGVKGARVSFGPRGTQVNAGVGPVRYRKQLSGRTPQNKILHDPTQPFWRRVAAWFGV